MAGESHDAGQHPDAELLEKFMRNEVLTAERRWIVRHLIAGCARCVAVTSKLWALGDSPARRRRLQGDGGPIVNPADSADPAAPSEPPERRSRRRQGSRQHQASYGDIFERLADADVGRRVERERQQAPRLVAELLASPPAMRAALVQADGPRATYSAAGAVAPGSPVSTVLAKSADPAGSAAFASSIPFPASAASANRFRTPAVCDALLDRSREAAATEPWRSLAAAELALAIAERLDLAVCGAIVVRGLRACAWAHLGHARRLGGDLDGAEWALAMAETLAAGASDPGEAGETKPAPLAPVPQLPPPSPLPPLPALSSHPPNTESSELAGRSAAAGPPAADISPASPAPMALEPPEWAELLVFKAGLLADRGDLGEADRLLERAASLYRAAAESGRAGRTLVQRGLIRAELGDATAAADLFRVGVGLLDEEPRLLAATLCRLAVQLSSGLDASPESKLADPAASPASSAPSAPSNIAGAHRRLGVEALQLLGRARAIYRGLTDPANSVDPGDRAAEARVCRLQGRIEAALGRLEDAEATLVAAAAALARHGLGREAALAQIDLALVLVRRGREAEVRPLSLDRQALLQARDKSWEWFAAVLVFQAQAVHDAANVTMLSELARYLAARPLQAPLPVSSRRLGRVA